MLLKLVNMANQKFFADFCINSQSILKKNLVHIHEIHSWTIFVLCVVFKSKYFWRYSRKTYFLPVTYIFQMTVTHSKIVRLTWFFSLGSGDSNEVVLFFKAYHFLKFMRQKRKKNWISWRPSWMFGCQLGLTMGTL